MSVYFSSQETIEAKVKAARINIWGDRNRDGELDADTLAQALTYAKSKILGYLQTRYGAQIHDWTLSDVPDLLRDISDTLTLFYIAAGQNAMNDVIKLTYDEVIETLKAIRNYEMDIPEVSDSDSYMTVTEDMESTFEEENYTYEGSDGDWTTAPAFFPR